jgi:hypothetical protein
MFARGTKRAPRRRSVPTTIRQGRKRAPLDAAGLILELEMAALIREAAPTLRQRADRGARRTRGWWRRLFF